MEECGKLNLIEKKLKEKGVKIIFKEIAIFYILPLLFM